MLCARLVNKGMKKALLYKKLGNNVVQCTACCRYCKISPGKTGICGARYNQDGDLQLLVYGNLIDICIDPIEKKPLFHFLPGTGILSIGTIGCNFGCEFCQNWEISQLPGILKQDTESPEKYVQKVTSFGRFISPRELVQICVDKKIPSIAYTYNEPSVFFEYAYDTSRLAHKAGIKNVFVSNGFASREAIDKIAPYLDAINIDLKAFSEEFYRDLCKAKLQPVLDNISYYYGKGIWTEVTTLVIPGRNDSSQELKEIARFLATISKSIPWHISRFSPTYKLLDVSSTPKETIRKAYEIGKEAGLLYVYAGNLFGEDVHSTYCPDCGNVLIRRDWDFTQVEELENGKCSKCHRVIDGVWK